MIFGMIYEIEFTTLPTGKRLHNYGKSAFFMGKSTTNSINDHFQSLCTRLDQEHPSRFQLGDLLSKGPRHLDTVGHWDEG